MKTLAEAVTTLAEHEFDLPQFLYEQGIRGSRRKGYACPVASYIHRETGDVTFVVPLMARTFEAYALLPHHVSEFVCDFDQGRYPELEIQQ